VNQGLAVMVDKETVGSPETAISLGDLNVGESGTQKSGSPH
jgi:hypothetical protein